jgi:hypothetical protein
MKRIFLLLVFFISANTYGATLNLEAGESTTIQANTATTVTCGADSSAVCKPKLDALGKLLNTCPRRSTTRLPKGTCLKEIMSKWSSWNPSCVTEGTVLCVKRCGNNAGCFSYCQ